MISLSRVFPQRAYFNRRLVFATVIVAISSFNYGFDNQGYATTQAMDAFERQFGWYNPSTNDYYLKTTWLSLFNSLQYITFACGVFIGSVVSAKLGRRWCITIMSCWALCTATISITASHRSQILAARVLNYIYIGMELSVVPVYQSEVVPPAVRGFVVSTYQLALLGGQLVINGICRGTQGMKTQAAFRIPYGMFYVVPSLVLTCIWFVPESPVWLISKGKIEQAKKSHRILRANTYPDDEIEEEFRSLQSAFDAGCEKPKFMEIFQGCNLKRTLIVAAANFFQQATGQTFASQYGSVWIKSLHTFSPFNMTLIICSCDIVVTLIAIFTADKIGRKPLLYTGTTIQAITLLIMGGLSCIQPQTASLKLAIISMLTIGAVAFSLGLATLIYVISTEVPSPRLRDHTVRVGFLTKVITNFVVSFSIPYIINSDYGNLSGRIGLIFGGICLLSLGFIYFCVPECKGRTPEEIELMFQHGVPLREFKSYDCSVLTSQSIAKQDGIVHVQATST